MEEIWKPVVDYEDRYEVSNLGRVKRLERVFVDNFGHNRHVKEMFMKVGSMNEVNLCGDFGYQTRQVRSLVAESFLGLSYGTCISHIDRDVTNARLDNLISTEEFRKMDPDWKDIPGWEGFYQVSRYGQVRSVDRFEKYRGGWRYIPGTIRTLDDSHKGYYQVALYGPGNRTKTGDVHRFLALAWIPNPENKPTVNHIDGNKKNNTLENLEWATWEEQQAHVKRIGLRKKPWWSLEQNGPVGGHWNESRQIRVRCIETGEEFESMSDAGRAKNLSASEIQRSINMHANCGGLHFVRADEPDYEFGVPSLDGEEWRDIPGFEGRYQISSMQRVKSVGRVVQGPNGNNRTVPEKLISVKNELQISDASGKQHYFTLSKLHHMVFPDVPQLESGSNKQKKLFKLKG